MTSNHQLSPTLLAIMVVMIQKLKTLANEVVDNDNGSVLTFLVGYESPRALHLWEKIYIGDVLGLMDNGDAHNFAQLIAGIGRNWKELDNESKDMKVERDAEREGEPNILATFGSDREGAAADWFQWMTRNGLITTWARFEESVRNYFGPSEYEDLNGALSKLLQLGMVKDYQREVEKLMNQATDIPDSLLISFYICALKLHLQREFLARLDDQAAPVASTITKTFGNNGGDESESSGLVTPTENAEAIESGDTLIVNFVFGHGIPRSL
uniref:Retrotransposon gag domain-containing protein n=1 Tax=Tanacetum cinerariifolium TaxID=118510 RepID=A0A6L2M9Q7_TANCI|nr:hypothetical protein [Tanacetum cinerariifolium]